MLQITDLTKELPEFSLKNINLSLPKGYIMGLVGVNACGKSTLIKTICNIYHKDSGSIRIDGMSMDEQEATIKNKLGIVLTENFYESNLSLEKNALYFGRHFEKYNHDVFLRYCRHFDIDPAKRLRKLSKGQQMKFQIAFALSHEASLFLMDEPTGNLDQAFRQEFMRICQELIEDGERSILLATHQTDTLDQIADFVTMMENGCIQFSMSKEEIHDKYLLVSGDLSSATALPDSLIVHLEHGKYHSMAMLHNPDFPGMTLTPREWEVYNNIISDTNLSCMVPTLEEIMYFKTKGDKLRCGNY